MIKLDIQNGHKNITNGQTGTSGIYNGVKINEVDLIDKVFYAIKEIIDKKYSKSIQLYYDDALCKNAPNMDYFIALHFDGSTNKNYNGGFVDCNPNSYTLKEDWAFAQKVADYYFQPMGITFSPEHRTDNSTYYYGFNYTGENTKQFLIELGTMTNNEDMSKIQDYKKIAELLMNGIVNFLGIKEDVSYSPIVNEDKDKIINDLKKQLQDKKEAYDALQKEMTTQLAKYISDCQVKCDKTIEDYKSKILVFIDEFKNKL